MQNLKLLSFALLGAGLLGFHLTTLTGCEASAEATGGAAGSSDAGSGGSTTAGSGGSTAGTAGTAGMAGEAGMAGMAGEAGMAGSGGSAGGPTSTSGANFAAALKGDEMCKACIEGLSGTAQDGGGQ
nr:hypothetical protein [Polyangiaceae bacterium]